MYLTKHTIKMCNCRIKRDEQSKKLKEQLTELGQKYFTVLKFPSISDS